MAIVPCRECAHQVSDRAASCPRCGAPIAFPVQPVQAVQPQPRRRRRLSTVLITLMALWTLGTVLWLIVPRSATDECIARARASLQSFDRGIGQFPAADTLSASVQSPKPQANPPAPDAQPVMTKGPMQPALPVRPVYRTTAEQLYRAYDANGVATQNRIGGSLVRLTGNVTEIDQDAAGHPVVKLSAGNDGVAAMTLVENQRVAAAQLYKGEAVDIECERIGRNGAVLQGNGCSLAFVDTRTREVNLALFLTNESGAAHIYVAGPMTQSVCQERGEQISSRLKGKQRGEYVVWRNCTEAARESIPPGTCRLNSPSVPVPDMPTAQLWRYDCSAPNVARTTSHKKRAASSTFVWDIAPAEPAAQSTEHTSLDPASPGVAAPIEVAVAAPSPTSQAVEHAATNNLRLASSVGGSDIGGATASTRVPAEEATVAHAPTPDDLSKIRATDPQAADHIANYCSKSVTSTNRDALVAYCRRSEAEAYTRLVLQNEFPTLTEAVRKKCSEPPFPDTFVAKESCARYELRAN